MELLVHRKTRTETSTIGDFSINGKFFSYCLEDKDRGLHSDMTLAEIAKIKVHGQTAIPTGRYQVTKYFSPKHNAFVPLLLHVPGFDMVEIHSGNESDQTDGCLLLGSTIDANFVGNSRVTIARFYVIFFEALNKDEQVFITYQ